MRCPIFCLSWTPEGRRLITGPKFGHSDLRPCFTFSVPEVIVISSHSGASSGEFTLWNGLTFNFETILQAHDSPVDKHYPSIYCFIGRLYEYIKGADDAMVAQRRVDGDRGPRWLHQVLAEQHEQREDVPGGLDDHHVVKELLTKVDLTHLKQNICWKQPIVQAHKEAIRRVSFCPTDAKFASCSDDGTVSFSLSKCPGESK